MMPGRDPAHSPAKYIYITRNPKDVAVSFYHHMNHTHHLTFNLDWNEYFESFLKGDVLFGSWFDHVLEWWKQKDADNILFMRYEDMKMDLPGSVKRISQFMGYSLEESVIDTIAEQCTIESMRADPLGNPDEYPPFKAVVDKSTSFLRKGIVGDWKNHFSDEQSSRFDAEYAKRMAGSGLDFI